ncbi:MAG: hypothetical protein KY476_24090, partial [Planctomycetes bacterium]|nr:hypothetical protein [Planctomycetota bacterium]
MADGVSHERLFRGYTAVREALLAARNIHGYWTGELSTSALSTATAVMALEMIRRAGRGPDGRAHEARLEPLIAGGVRWLAEHQNADGGWGDTTKSVSNISTTMLAHATFHATAKAPPLPKGGLG